MPIEQQRTFGKVVGLPPTVAPHRDPTPCDDEETFYDCRGESFSDEDERDDSDVTIVEEILNERVAGCAEYARENDDYTSGYDHIIGEVSHEWADRIGEWLDEHCDDWTGHSKYDDHREGLIQSMCVEFEDSWDGEWEYGHNEYAAYSGSGCCIWGFDIGECEEQVGVSDHDEFADLNTHGRLTGILNRTNCDAYLGTINDNDLSGSYPCFEFYHSPGGRWDFIVSEDKMDELFVAAIIATCRQSDK
jgi:hypothetical protein